MLFRKTLLVASMLGAALLGGCLHPPKNSGVAVVGGKVWVYDPSFAVNIQLVKDDMTRTPQGFLHVQTTLQNTNHEDWNCQYRCRLCRVRRVSGWSFVPADTRKGSESCQEGSFAPVWPPSAE